jgi:alanine dehydrogenase
LAKGVTVVEGHVTYQPVAEAHQMTYTELSSLL